MNLYVIPTNRLVLNAAESLCKEICSTSEKNNTIIILDNSEKSIFEQNLMDMKKLTKKYDINIYVSGLEQQKKLVREIEDALKCADLDELLIPYGVDYGKVFNMIYLYTVLLGEESFHRRDSDCLVEQINNEKDYPIHRELDFLGKTVDEIKNDISIIEEVVFDDDKELLIVGSDYFGDWNLDLSEIINENKEALYEFFDLMSIPHDAIQKQIDDKYAGTNENRMERPILKTSFSVPQYPDCGNVSMKTIFKYLPNFIGDYDNLVTVSCADI